MALLNLLETGAAAGVSKFTPLFLAARGLEWRRSASCWHLHRSAGSLGACHSAASRTTGRFRGLLGQICKRRAGSATRASLALAAAAGCVYRARASHRWFCLLYFAVGYFIDAVAVVPRQAAAQATDARAWAATMAWPPSAWVERRPLLLAVFIAYRFGGRPLVARRRLPRILQSRAASTPRRPLPRSVFLVAPVPASSTSSFTAPGGFCGVLSLLLLWRRGPATPNWFLGLLICCCCVRDPCLSIRE